MHDHFYRQEKPLSQRTARMEYSEIIGCEMVAFHKAYRQRVSQGQGRSGGTGWCQSQAVRFLFNPRIQNGVRIFSQGGFRISHHRHQFGTNPFQGWKDIQDFGSFPAV